MKRRRISRRAQVAGIRQVRHSSSNKQAKNAVSVACSRSSPEVAPRTSTVSKGALEVTTTKDRRRGRMEQEEDIHSKAWEVMEEVMVVDIRSQVSLFHPFCGRLSVVPLSGV